MYRCNKSSCNSEIKRRVVKCDNCQKCYHPGCANNLPDSNTCCVSFTEILKTKPPEIPPSASRTDPKTHLVLADSETAPTELPAGWEEKDLNAKLNDIFRGINTNNNDNKSFREQLLITQSKLNLHTTRLNNHEEQMQQALEIIDDNKKEISELKQACSVTSPACEIVVDVIPNNLNLNNQDILTQILEKLKCTPFKPYILSIRDFKRKTNPQQSTRSIIVEFLSDKICDKIIVARIANKNFIASEIFDTQINSPIFINKILSPYLHKLFTEARRLKKVHGWKSVKLRNNSLLICKDQSTEETVYTMSDLQKLI